MHGSAVQIAFLFLQILWMFSVSGSRSMCALVCTGLEDNPKGFIHQIMGLPYRLMQSTSYGHSFGFFWGFFVGRQRQMNFMKKHHVDFELRCISSYRRSFFLPLQTGSRRMGCGVCLLWFLSSGLNRCW